MSTIKEHIGIADLQRLGLPIIPGNKYIPKSWLPKKTISLAEVRRRLAKIKGSLAQTISEIRDTES